MKSASGSNLNAVWIIGAGRFGIRAAEKLSERFSRLVMVASNHDKFDECRSARWDFYYEDGADFLLHMDKSNCPSWIIPAVPVHLAVEWYLRRIGPNKTKRIGLPDSILTRLPNAVRGVNDDIYVSHANFKCPETCDEPEDICTVTRKPRKPNLFDMLQDFQLFSFRSLVIRSYQLAPGVGGYTPQQLFKLAENIEKKSGKIMIGTACRCHGVISGIELIHS